MLTNNASSPEQSELGKQSDYETAYNPDKLFPMPRAKNRQTLGFASGSLPFYGFDVWNHYEVSWLNERGKPCVAIAELIIPCESANIIESKSMKLYFNTFNNTSFKSAEALEALIQKDLSLRLETDAIVVRIKPLSQMQDSILAACLMGESIDELDVSCSTYHTEPTLLVVEEDEAVEEILCSDLLKSNCLVTHQPDWCSLQIQYQGRKINREGLLRYIVSFRNDNEFHEHCIEKIFMHLMQYCAPTFLRVYGRSTRRGGIDINSIRSTHPIDPGSLENIRLIRQ
jgi:7-cyano-7-deazaguanine reductase